MFDFQATLELADKYAAEKNASLAAFHYWLIGFAYNDEELPYGYTETIGTKGRKGFLKFAKKNPALLLTTESYIQFKENHSIFPAYQNYFANFERVINSCIRKKNKKEDNTSDDSFYIGFPY